MATSSCCVWAVSSSSPYFIVASSSGAAALMRCSVDKSPADADFTARLRGWRRACVESAPARVEAAVRVRRLRAKCRCCDAHDRGHRGGGTGTNAGVALSRIDRLLSPQRDATPAATRGKFQVPARSVVLDLRVHHSRFHTDMPAARHRSQQFIGAAAARLRRAQHFALADQRRCKSRSSAALTGEQRRIKVLCNFRRSYAQLRTIRACHLRY